MQVATSRQMSQSDSVSASLRSLRRLLLGPAGQTVAAIVLPAFLAKVLGTGNIVGTFAYLVAEMMLAVLLLICVHEGGHLIAGHLVGFEFVYLVFGPLKIESTDRGIGLSVNDDRQRYGAVVGVPTRMDNLGPRAAVMVAGGPIANLLLALVLAAIAQEIAFGLPTRLLLAGTALMSLVTGAVNALPVEWRGRMSDGAWMKTLFTDGAAAERACANWILLGVARMGRRPRNWDAAWVERAIALADGSDQDAQASKLAYYWALDRRDVDWARELLERTLNLGDQFPADARPGVFAEAAFFAAHFLKDAPAGRAWLVEAAAALEALPEPAKWEQAARAAQQLELLRAEAAVLLAEGYDEQAHATCEEWLALREEYAPTLPGVVRAVRDWVREIGAASAPAAREATATD